VESSADEGPRGVQTDWPGIKATSIEGDTNCDKVISSAARLEGKIGKEIGEKNVDKPVIFTSPTIHKHHSHHVTRLLYPQPHLSPKYPMTHPTSDLRCRISKAQDRTQCTSQQGRQRRDGWARRDF